MNSFDYQSHSYHLPMDPQSANDLNHNHHQLGYPLGYPSVDWPDMNGVSTGFSIVDHDSIPLDHSFPTHSLPFQHPKEYSIPTTVWPADYSLPCSQSALSMNCQTQQHPESPTDFSSFTDFSAYSASESLDYFSTDVSASETSESSESPGSCSDCSDCSNTVGKLRLDSKMWKVANTVKKGIYVCSHCAKKGEPIKFKTLVDFAAHVDEHEHNRPCKCPDSSCPWSIVGFSTRSEMNRHTKSLHRDEYFTCDHCDREFGREDSLKRHIKLLHAYPASLRSPTRLAPSPRRKSA